MDIVINTLYKLLMDDIKSLCQENEKDLKDVFYIKYNESISFVQIPQNQSISNVL
jgi:hypothetical protein